MRDCANNLNWLTFQVALWRCRFAVIFGQRTRSYWKHWASSVGASPMGNTGGTNATIFKRMPIDTEVWNIIDGRASFQNAEGKLAWRS